MKKDLITGVGTAELPFFQFLEPFGEETALRLVPIFIFIFAGHNQGERLLIGGAGLRNPSQPATQIRTGRVREVIVGEFLVLARQQAIDEAKPLFRTIAHGNRHRAVQFDHRRWMNLKQAIIEQRNLAPVRGCRGGTPGVNGRNRRL